MAPRFDGRKGRLGSPSPRAAISTERGITADPAAMGEMARQKILSALPEILDALIGKAKDGSYLHANFLFAFAGLDQMENEEEAPGGGSLAELLLSRLEGREIATPSAKQESMCEGEPVPAS